MMERGRVHVVNKYFSTETQVVWNGFVGASVTLNAYLNVFFFFIKKKKAVRITYLKNNYSLTNVSAHSDFELSKPWTSVSQNDVLTGSESFE